MNVKKLLKGIALVILWYLVWFWIAEVFLSQYELFHNYRARGIFDDVNTLGKLVGLIITIIVAWLVHRKPSTKK